MSRTCRRQQSCKLTLEMMARLPRNPRNVTRDSACGRRSVCQNLSLSARGMSTMQRSLPADHKVGQVFCLNCCKWANIAQTQPL